LSYCPRSSLPAHVLAWLAARLAHLYTARPPRAGRHPTTAAGGPPGRSRRGAVDGLSSRRAGRMVGILQDRGRRQPGPAAGPAWRPRLLPARRQLQHHPGRPARTAGGAAAAGAAVCVGGLATRVQRPKGVRQPEGPGRPKRHTHTAQGLSVSTSWGDLLWLDGGWPGACHEHELIELAGLQAALDEVQVASLLDRGFGAWPSVARTGMRRSGTAAPSTGLPRAAGVQPPAGRAARPGRAVHRPPWQRLSVAPLAGCCTGSGASSAPSARWSALVASCTGSPHDKSTTDTLTAAADQVSARSK
jgi:hypothetical protein